MRGGVICLHIGFYPAERFEQVLVDQLEQAKGGHGRAQQHHGRHKSHHLPAIQHKSQPQQHHNKRLIGAQGGMVYLGGHGFCATCPSRNGGHNHHFIPLRQWGFGSLQIADVLLVDIHIDKTAERVALKQVLAQLGVLRRQMSQCCADGRAINHNTGLAANIRP